MSGDNVAPLGAGGAPSTAPASSPAAATLRRLVYVAGPYADPDPKIRERNVHRATTLGRVVLAEGHAPLVPHALGALGIYGAADESDPETRRHALECGVAAAAMVGASPRGQVWAIGTVEAIVSQGRGGAGFAWITPTSMDEASPLDGLSEGTRLEVEACIGAGGTAWIRPWRTWRSMALCLGRKVST